MPLRDRQPGGRRPKRGSGGPSGLRIGLAAAVLVLLLGGGAWLEFKGRSSAIETDRDNCPTQRPPSALTVILLDMSDELSDAERLGLQNELTRARQRVPRLGLIEVFAVGTSGTQLIRPVIHVCNPGDGADLNRLYQNPDLARKRWDEFDRKFSEELEAQIDQPAGAESHIFEAIQAAALRTLDSPKYDTTPKELLIVSDLIQNVPGRLSLYRERPDFEQFSRSSYFTQIRADLSGVSTYILLLVRPSVRQDTAWLVNFWERYLAAQGAQVESVQPIYGE